MTWLLIKYTLALQISIHVIKFNIKSQHSCGIDPAAGLCSSHGASCMIQWVTLDLQVAACDYILFA